MCPELGRGAGLELGLTPSRACHDPHGFLCLFSCGFFNPGPHLRGEAELEREREIFQLLIRPPNARSS